MSSYKLLAAIFACAFFLSACGNSGGSWTEAVPEETTFVILPQQDATVQSVINSEYMPFLEDISAAAVQLVAEIDSNATQSMPLQSILMHPGTDQKMQPIWITRAPDDFLERVRSKYARSFAQNKYNFEGTTILSLQIGDRDFFLASGGNFLMMSESSNGIESIIRVQQGELAGANIAGLELSAGSLLLNTPALDSWISQMARVAYHPNIKGAMQGTGPTILNVQSQAENQRREIQLTGSIPLEDEKSPLVRAISNENRPFTLDQYISSNAAAFGIFRMPAAGTLPDTLPDTTNADSHFISNSDVYTSMGESMDAELGLVMYAQSGFLSSGEYLFLRKLSNPAAFSNRLESLSRQGVISSVDSVYFAQSHALSQLIGSELCGFKDFYINVVNDVAVISKRKGLTELVTSDRQRRRVISYEPFYEEIKNGFPEQLSGLFVAGPEFSSYLSPYLTTGSSVDAFTSSFNYLAFTAQLDENAESLAINIATFNRSQQDQPFRENWFYNVGGAELSGPPTFGNIAGNFNDEAVFATNSGRVYVIGSDGTLIQQFDTGTDVPVGSPVVYDWYGTGQNIVLQAAGDKIYGWNENGEPLPKFPFRLTEAITTPLIVTDINGNRIPDAIVATEDRRLHALNGRGNNLPGWPVTTNAPIRTKPYVGEFRNQMAVVAYSSNAAHAWDASGNLMPNFPQFINGNFNGSPVPFGNALLGGAVDGNLYALGPEIPFSDSLNISGSGATIGSINVSNQPLLGTPDTAEDQILSTAQNGSIFLFDATGQLQLTKNMGQPSASNWPARLMDINGDGTTEIVALASYGRLYAWRTSDGERIFNLPTAGMRHLSIGDMDGDELMELVAQTDEGVQSWTINR